MPSRARHYAGRTIDVLVGLLPQRFHVPLQYHKHTLLLRWEPEARLIRRFALAVDVGANMGLWSYAMVRCGLFQRVVALEPNSSLTAVLRSMHLPQLTILHKAVSSKAGTRTLRIPKQNEQALPGWASLEDHIDVATNDFQELLVETIRLDDLALEDVGFIKIDVEGHELSLLEGSREMFAASRPVCLIECRARNEAPVQAYFESLHVGYKRVDTNARFGFDLTAGNLLFAAT
jgi:FkbM family methyltransferase